MVDIKNRHRRFIAEFIELYKSYPTLWDLKSPEYTDRDTKRDAYIKLVNKLREIEPDCTKEDVIKKINSLRSAFRREYKKVRRMKACGKLYKPSLWYYDLISFTMTDNYPKLRANFLKILSEGDKVNSDSGTSSDPLNVTPVKHEENECVVEDYSTFETEENNMLTKEDLSTNTFKQYLDEFDAVGYNVASKLRNMDRKQRIIAERVIAETLFQGQMGTLSVNNTSTSDFLPTLLCDGTADINLPP